MARSSSAPRGTIGPRRQRVGTSALAKTNSRILRYVVDGDVSEMEAIGWRVVACYGVRGPHDLFIMELSDGEDTQRHGYSNGPASGG
jgi:hypothetical protein